MSQGSLLFPFEKERAKRIIAVRGRRLPYTPADFDNHVSPEECAVISEAVQIWLPFIDLEERKL